MPTLNMTYSGTYGTDTGKTLANNYTFFYNRVALTEANQNNIYSKLFMTRVQPTKNGKEYRFKRRKRILPFRPEDEVNGTDWLTGTRDIDKLGWTFATNADGSVNGSFSEGTAQLLLAEGSGRVNQVFVENVTFSGTLNRIGNFIGFTDEIEIFSEEGKRELAGFSQELGILAGKAVDDYFQALAINAIQNEYYVGAADLATMTQADGKLGAVDTTAGATAGNGHNKAITATEDIASALFQDEVKPTRTMLTGSTNTDTKVIGATYVKIVHPDIAYHYETVGREEGWFIPLEKYADALSAKGASAMDNEIGSIGKTRIVVSPRAFYKMVGATSTVKAYPCIIFGEDAFVSIALQGENAIKTRVIDPKVKENSNPYGTQGLISYNTWVGGRLYNEDASWIMWETSSKND